MRNNRIFKRGILATVIAGLIFISILIPPKSDPLADPLIKPKKYHGPIPRKSLTLAFGFFGGAENQDFWLYLDGLVDQALRSETETNDFSSSPALDLIFTNKVHPNFAMRARGGVSFLSSDSRGRFVTQDTTLVEFDRKFDVTLFALEVSGLFYFQDASVKEFQIFAGGGFDLFFPYQQWSSSTVNFNTGEPLASESLNQWSAEPGVHGILGMLYHFRNTWAITAEGRAQIAQSKFEIELPTISDGVQPLNFDVDYTGFTLTLGIARFF